MRLLRSRPWLFSLTQDYQWDASQWIVRDIAFDNPWLCINLGIITVKQGYSWDGCTPKWALADLWVIGTPDGRLHYGLPITYHASLIHDALVQFRHQLPITQQQATAIFDAMLAERQFAWRKLYVWAVSHFGPQDFAGDQPGGAL